MYACQLVLQQPVDMAVYVFTAFTMRGDVKTRKVYSALILPACIVLMACLRFCVHCMRYVNSMPLSLTHYAVSFRP